MRMIHKGKKLLAMLLAATLLTCLFPVVYAEEPAAETAAEEVTPVTVEEQIDVTEPVPAEAPAEEPAPEPMEEPAPEPVAEPMEEPIAEPAEEPAEAPAEEPEEAPAPEATPAPAEEEPAEEPAEEPVIEPIQEEITPEPDIQWDPYEEDADNEDADDEEFEPEDEGDDEEYFEFDDDDAGYVDDELLEQFNNPDTYEQVEFCGTADIELKQDSFAYGDTVTLVAKVRGVEISYRLQWEANDQDDRGWYTIASGDEYSFTVTPENMEREYRVVLFAVD